MFTIGDAVKIQDFIDKEKEDLDHQFIDGHCYDTAMNLLLPLQAILDSDFESTHESG